MLSCLLPIVFAQITVKLGFAESNGEEKEDLLKSDLLNSLAELYLSGGLSGGLGGGCGPSALWSGWLAQESGWLSGWLAVAAQGFVEAQRMSSRRLGLGAEGSQRPSAAQPFPTDPGSSFPAECFACVEPGGLLPMSAL